MNKKLEEIKKELKKEYPFWAKGKFSRHTAPGHYKTISMLVDIVEKSLEMTEECTKWIPLMDEYSELKYKMKKAKQFLDYCDEKLGDKDAEKRSQTPKNDQGE